VIRVLVVRRPTLRTLDGLSLLTFEPGQEYELGNLLGALFLAEGWAVPVPLDAPASPVPFGPDDPYDARLLYHDRRAINRRQAASSTFRDTAADRRLGQRRKKTR